MPEVEFAQRDCVYNWRVRYTRLGSEIVVRIKLDNLADADAVELSRLRDNWHFGIIGKWDNQFALSDTGSLLRVRVEWVDEDEHYTVQVVKGPERSNMLVWDTLDDGHVASHEFGHMVGLKDEYAYNLTTCQDRSPVNTNTVMEVPRQPVVQRLVDLISQAESQASIVRTRPSFRLISPGAARLLFSISSLRVAQTIAGGFPGESVHLAVALDEQNRRASLKHSDQIRGVSALRATGAFDLDTIGSLKTKILAILESPEHQQSDDAQLLPDTIVGEISAMIGRETLRVYYPVKELHLPPEDSSAEESLLTFQADTNLREINATHLLVLKVSRTASISTGRRARGPII